MWEIVDRNYLDARRTGFSRAKFRRLRDEALKGAEDRRSAYKGIRYMLSKSIKDRYTRFLSPGEFASLAKYDISGVGVNLGTGEEFEQKVGPLPAALAAAADRTDVFVLGLINGSEAEAAGIRQGDMLLEVDGASLARVSPFDVASLLQGSELEDGAPRAVAEVKLRSFEGGRTRAVRLKRPEKLVAANPVDYSLQSTSLFSLEEKERGLIRLKEFNSKAKTEVAHAVQDLTAQGATEFVLDMRGNPGGLVKEGIEVAGIFLGPEQPVVYVENRTTPKGDRGTVQATTETSEQLTEAPLSVIIDSSTASASEVTAGALRDNCRAVLVGPSNSFGKGLIQSVYEFSDGSGLVMTVGRYITPARTDIDREGLKPDFRSVPAKEDVQKKLKACKVKAAKAQAKAKQAKRR